MADVIRERQYVVGDRRVDDIEAHERRWWQSNGLLLALLGLLALALIAMFLYDRGRSARMPVIEEPTLPQVAVAPPEVREPVLVPPPAPPPVEAPAVIPPAPPIEEKKAVTPPVEEKKVEVTKPEEKKVEAPKPAVTPKALPAPTNQQQMGQAGALTAPRVVTSAAEPMHGCKRVDVYFTPQGIDFNDKNNKGDKALDELAACLRKNPNAMVRLEGRSDGVELQNGDTLATNRAQMLADELKERGVCPSRVKVINAEATCTQQNAWCRQQNRSVSIISDY